MTFVFYYQAKSFSEMEIFETEYEKIERFYSYETVELRKNWSLVSKKNDDQIIFENVKIGVQVTVTMGFKWTIKDEEEKKGFIRDDLSIENIQELLRNIELGKWKDETKGQISNGKIF